jgi:predicted deacylase
MQETVVPEPDDREGSKTPEMPVEAPSEPPPPKVHPELAEFDVPERILRLVESLPDVQEYILDLHKTFRSFKNATAALQQARLRHLDCTAVILIRVNSISAAIWGQFQRVSDCLHAQEEEESGAGQWRRIVA